MQFPRSSSSTIPASRYLSSIALSHPPLPSFLIDRSLAEHCLARAERDSSSVLRRACSTADSLPPPKRLDRIWRNAGPNMNLEEKARRNPDSELTSTEGSVWLMGVAYLKSGLQVSRNTA